MHSVNFNMKSIPSVNGKLLNIHYSAVWNISYKKEKTKHIKTKHKKQKQQQQQQLQQQQQQQNKNKNNQGLLNH